MAWFRRSDSQKETDPARARELLAEAQALRAQGDLTNAAEVAKAALDEGTQVHGDRPALVPFLLVYAGLLNQIRGWAAGKPFYEKAQRLRGAMRPRPGARVTSS